MLDTDRRSRPKMDWKPFLPMGVGIGLGFSSAREVAAATESLGVLPSLLVAAPAAGLVGGLAALLTTAILRRVAPSKARPATT